jgi:S-formylglutathione hydrolase FrmB
MKKSLPILVACLAAACSSPSPSSALPGGAHDAAPEASLDDLADHATPNADAATTNPEAGASDTRFDGESDGPPSASVDGANSPDRSEVGVATDATISPTSDASTLPAPPPPGYPAGSAPRTEQKSFVGPTTHQTIGFNVYLPPGYDSGAMRYPTVYDLHGLTGNQFEDGQWVIPSLEAAMKKNLIGPVIVVFPDGLQESYYADSADGKKPSETRIIRELIPLVDATYRTVANRQLRAVTGFSMGGYGAMELGTKFPELFRVAVAYDAALDTWQTLVGRRASIAQATFGNDETYFDKYSPWANATKNVAVLRASSALRLVPGTTYQMFDAAFRDHLAGLPLPLDYVETTCPHDYGCALGAQGAQSWTFIQSAFGRP